jgi:hypothetical protein
MVFEISPQANSCNRNLPVTSTSPSGAIISIFHHNGNACNCISIGQATSAVSLSRNSSTNDACNARSGVVNAQCVETQDVTCSNIHDTGDDNFLAAGSNFFGDLLQDSCVPARQAAPSPASTRTCPRQNVGISCRSVDYLSRWTFQKYGSREREDKICANATVVPEEVTRHARHPEFGCSADLAGPPSASGRVDLQHAPDSWTGINSSQVMRAPGLVGDDDLCVRGHGTCTQKNHFSGVSCWSQK